MSCQRKKAEIYVAGVCYTKGGVTYGTKPYHLAPFKLLLAHRLDMGGWSRLGDEVELEDPGNAVYQTHREEALRNPSSWIRSSCETRDGFPYRGGVFSRGRGLLYLPACRNTPIIMVQKKANI